MIVYTNNKKSFLQDIKDGVIADRLDSLFYSLQIEEESLAEYNSWKASLPVMAHIISDHRIDDEVQVALEYQIPLTSKRIDFMIAGSNGTQDNIVIVELKQWESCQAISRDNVVSVFTGGEVRVVDHPSHQAYLYAKFIQNFNTSISKNDIGLIPCAYLHNFKEKNRNSICHQKYKGAIDDAPVFLKEDSEKFSSYIAQYISKPSNKDLFKIIDKGKLKPSKTLQETVGKILNGNDEFDMIDEQQVAYATVLKLVQNSLENESKHVIIVQGGPGTGKSVIAINLLAKLVNKGYSCAYVTKTGAPRYTFSQGLIQGRHKIGYLKGLFKSSGTFYNVPLNTYTCLLADEAHRLNKKSVKRSGSGKYYNVGENQIKEIINASKISVFFLDEDQIVTMKDIGTIKEIKEQAGELGAIVHCNNSLKLTSQFRCNGSDGYIAFLNDVLQIQRTANRSSFNINYDIRVFDDAVTMRETLRKYNSNNKARMIAGYCYPWISDKDKSKMDIILRGGFEAQWNFNTNSFATDKNSFEQVGCIHSTQGLEFDYVGVIVGLDMKYNGGKVITDYKQRYLERDKTIANVHTLEDIQLADKIIRNTYKTLLSRGQKGCFIYCEDTELRNYIKKRLEFVKQGR